MAHFEAHANYKIPHPSASDGMGRGILQCLQVAHLETTHKLTAPAQSHGRREFRFHGVALYRSGWEVKGVGWRTGFLISPLAGWKTGGLTEDGCVALLQVVDFLQPPPAPEVRGNMVRIKAPPPPTIGR